MDFWKRVYGCCSATSDLIFIFFFLVQYFGCWWQLSPTAKIMEDMLVARGLGGFSAWLLRTQGVYYARHCLCTVFHRILLVALYLQVSMGLTWLRHLPHTMAPTHHCCLFPVSSWHFWDQAQGPAGHFWPRECVGSEMPGSVPSQAAHLGPHQAEPRHLKPSTAALLYKLFSTSTDAFSSAFSQWLPSLMHPLWCIKLVN